VKIKTSAATLLIAAILNILGYQIARAADIPVMTWERGKEQSIVLGGSAVPQKWNLRLDGPSGEILKFHSSVANAKGFVVYSAVLPENLNLGNYFLKSVKNGDQDGPIIAGVNVIPMATYSLVQIPFDLIVIILFFTGLITLLSITKRKNIVL